MKSLWICFTGTFLLILASCSFQFDALSLDGLYVARYSFGTDSLQLSKSGEYHQWVSVIGDSTVHEAYGNWKFDSTSNYITFENRMLIIDGFGKLKKDYATPSIGASVLPVWRKFLVGEIHLGTDELTPYKKVDEER